jgi:hypothetical protein
MYFNLDTPIQLPPTNSKGERINWTIKLLNCSISHTFPNITQGKNVIEFTFGGGDYVITFQTGRYSIGDLNTEIRRVLISQSLSGGLFNLYFDVPTNTLNVVLFNPGLVIKAATSALQASRSRCCGSGSSS